jgi:hypothetical protein
MTRAIKLEIRNKPELFRINRRGTTVITTEFRKFLRKTCGVEAHCLALVTSKRPRNAKYGFYAPMIFYGHHRNSYVFYFRDPRAATLVKLMAT